MNCNKCLLFAFALILTACGTDSHHFKIEGRLLHLNQGEFYIYSPTGDIDGVDTLKVEAGRFALEIPCEKPTTLMIVFPNFTEQPIFAEPGKTVDIKGDASHLSEMTIKGGKANELMNGFRKRIAHASPPEKKRIAIETIQDNPHSPIGPYLVATYVLDDRKPDYGEALRLVELIRRKQPDNNELLMLRGKVEQLRQSALGGRMPNFTLRDINGNVVSGSSLAAAPLAVVVAWSTSYYESLSLLQQVRMWQERSGGQVKFLTICADPDVRQCRESLRNGQLTCQTICDGNMFDSRAMRLFGFYNLPGNAVFRRGQLIDHGLSQQELNDKLQPYLTR